MKKIEKEVEKISPKGAKYISFVIGIIFILISFSLYAKQIKTGKYIKENYGEAVYNIFSDNKLLTKTTIKESDEEKYLWYVAEDSGRLEIVKEKDDYYIYLLSNTSEDKIQIFPFFEIEKQNPNRLYKVARVVDGDTIKIIYNEK